MKIEVKKAFVSGHQLAQVLGLSNMRITQLEQKEIIRREKDRKFNLCESVIAYINSVKRTTKTQSDANYEKARARKMEAAADIEEMNASKKRGELVEIDSVIDIVESEYAIVRQRLFTIPNKVALDIYSCESPQEVQEVLLTQMNEALSELKFDIGTEANGVEIENSETSSEVELS